MRTMVSRPTAIVAVTTLALILAVGFWAKGDDGNLDPIAVDRNGLSRIGQAIRRYARDHEGHLPQAEDTHDCARLLAREAGLDDGNVWMSAVDPASDSSRAKIATVLDASHQKLDPSFETAVLSYAVPVGSLMADMPASTPVAWTRGLQGYGSWSPDSPYGMAGGLILFRDGHAAWYADIQAPERKLLRFDGQGTTSDVLAALPPGTRIDDYRPTPAESRAWSSAPRRSRYLSWYARWRRDELHESDFWVFGILWFVLPTILGGTGMVLGLRWVKRRVGTR